MLPEEQENCRRRTDLFKVFSDKFKPQRNEAMLSLQYCKLTKELNKNAEEWMVSNECGYKKKTEG